MTYVNPVGCGRINLNYLQSNNLLLSFTGSVFVLLGFSLRFEVDTDPFDINHHGNYPPPVHPFGWDSISGRQCGSTSRGRGSWQRESLRYRRVRVVINDKDWNLLNKSLIFI